MQKNKLNFQEKFKAWCGGKIPSELMEKTKAIEKTYQKWGRADADRGRKPSQYERFMTLGKLVFPDCEDADMAEALAAHMRICYLDGYKNGGAA